MSHYLTTSDQLELALDDKRLKIPWEGRSPRELTRVHTEGIFKASAAKSVSASADLEQGDLFLEATKELRRYDGAPLLFEPRRLRKPKRGRR